MRAIISSKMAQCSGAVVLDLLLGQTDRNNARNVVFGTDPAEPESGRFLFLDFANTMNMGDQWANGKWKEIKDPGFPEVMTKSVSKAVLKETVDKMRALHPETIEQIISRIEHPFLSERYKGILMDAIKGRQGLVVDYVNTRYLGGGG